MAKALKVAKVGIKRKAGFLYFIDKEGDISMVPMNRAGKIKKSKAPAKKKAAAKKPAAKKKVAKKR